MSDADRPDPDSRNDSRRMPPWAGYVLIAADVVRQPLFLVPWLGTCIALSLALPAVSFWLRAGLVVLASAGTLAGVTRAVAVQASQRGALGAYVARLATQTSLGRWLTDWLSGSSQR